MRQIIDRLFVGDLGDCRDIRPAGLAVIHACRQPCHAGYCAERHPGETVDASHASYLSVRSQDGQELYLNLIDPPTPLFRADSFRAFLSFASERWKAGDRLLIHCNKGQSRAPSLALVFMAKALRALPNESFDRAWDAFEQVAGPYTPGAGIETWLRENWHKIDAEPVAFIDGAAPKPAQQHAEIPAAAQVFSEGQGPATPIDSLASIYGSPFVHFYAGARITPKDGVLTPPDQHIVPNVFQARACEAYEWCIANGVPVRLVLGPKPRQSGGSTISAELCYYHTQRFHCSGMVIADENDRTDLVWNMFNRMAEDDRFRALWGTRHHWNTEHASFTYKDDEGVDRECEWLRDTANDPKAGASGTRQILWCSEAGRYSKEGKVTDTQVISNASSSVPDKANTLIILESTAEGASGYFYNTVMGAVTLEERMKGRVGNGWIKVSCWWHEVPDYFMDRTPANEEWFQGALDQRERRGVELYSWTAEQIAWRRKKIKGSFDGNERLFDQEFPESEECVAGHVRVGTSAGIIPIREVMAGSKSDHGIVLQAMSKGIRKVIQLRTEYGYSVTATPDHRIALADGSFCCAAECMGKDIKLQAPTFADNPHVIKWQEFASVECCVTVTKEWARFLGFFMGDGSFSGDTLSVAFDAKDENSFQECLRLCANLFGIEACTWRFTSNRTGCKEIRVNRRELGRVFDAMGLLEPVQYKGGAPTRRRKIHVPECIWRSPKDHVREFLRALFDADGWISETKRMVKLFSKYREFMIDVQFLLLGFGIHCRVREVARMLGAKRHVGYELCIYALDSAKFIEEINFISDRKRARGVQPVRIRSGRPGVFKAMADTIVSITDAGEEEVFDLTISDEPVFGAGGILVHNCAFQSSGNPRFSIDGMTRLERMAIFGHEQATLGTLELNGGMIQFTPGQEVPWLWIKEHPMYGARYIMFADCMTGEQSAGSLVRDTHAPGIWRAPYKDPNGQVHGAKLVATIHVPGGCRWDEDVLAVRMHLLSKFYGNCIMVIEVNEAMGVLRELIRLGANLWKRTKTDEASGIAGATIKIPGWKTTGGPSGSRSLLVAAMAAFIREQEGEVHYMPMVKQLKTFVLFSDGSCAAKPGEHDDWVLGPALGLVCMDAATEFKPPRAVTPSVHLPDPGGYRGKGSGAMG